MRTAEAIRSELRTAVDAGLRASNGGNGNEADRLLAKAESLHSELRNLEHDERVRTIGGVQYIDAGAGPDLAGALLRAGFDRKTHPQVTVEQHHALGVRFKSGSVDGGVDGTEIEDVFVAPLLGSDDRYLYPKLRVQRVTSDQLGVSSYRQKSRSLASPSSMIRDVDETSSKPETDTTAEAVHEPLHQIAHISSGTPNVLLENEGFRSWVNSDMVTGYRNAVDYHVVTEINAAGMPGGGGGANDFENILYSQEVVRAAGYSPNLVVVSPTDALAIQLLQLSGGDSYVFTQPAPSFVVTTAVNDGEGFVADASALGILFLSPFSLKSFEEEAGQTNTSTVRAESTGLFLVQRPDAAATLTAS
jgi:hypothetical protein